MLGSGVGLSIFSPIIIATEKSVFGMPEAKIGACVGVGVSFVFARLRSKIGVYLGE